MNNNLPQDDINTIIQFLKQEYMNTKHGEIIIDKKESLGMLIKYLIRIRKSILNQEYNIGVVADDGSPINIGDYHLKMHVLEELNIISFKGNENDADVVQNAMQELLKNKSEHKAYLLMPCDIKTIKIKRRQ